MNIKQKKVKLINVSVSIIKEKERLWLKINQDKKQSDDRSAHVKAKGPQRGRESA